jgi:hypothetical protein
MGVTTMTKEERITHWRAIMRNQSASGLSVAAFCREHDIRAHQFHWWRHRLRKIDSLAKESGFIKLVPISTPQPSGIRIHLSGGVFIEVEQGFDPPTLRAAVETLQTQGSN